MSQQKLWFMSDYMEGACPEIMEALAATNLEHTPGYGTDEYCAQAREKIREAIDCPQAEVHFLVGGTQTNATVIDALLKGYQGVIAAASGHINVHESGAIEFGGHKVLALPQKDGKISTSDIEARLLAYENDPSRDHTVMPGMVYISQPTEYGTLYSLKELEEISRICKVYGIYLYVDGARLAYALACRENDVSLPDLARLADAFYIGGTKCGALFGEAVVFTRPGTAPHFVTTIKQHGAMLAKGRLLGVQFETLFSRVPENASGADGGTDRPGCLLYERLGENGMRTAAMLRKALKDKGYKFLIDSPTNQIFVVMEDSQIEKLSQNVNFEFWERVDPTHSAVRFVTGWATTDEDIEALAALL
ncbi:MAG: aminotransferase class V-fold PLP-dependent enzyme [Firmicutes bacterium]|nr:aminotransferase class V-fold PLP-dependent enzyme [Bacillota bacterium]